MKILFIGENKGNSIYTYFTFKKLNSTTKFINTTNILSKLNYHLFCKFNPNIFKFKIKRYFINKLSNKKYDLIFIFNCEFISDEVLQILKSCSKKIYFVCLDNPFLKRDFKRWNLLLEVINKFDLVIFQQKNREKFAKRFHIKNFITILPPFFKEIQKPLKKNPKLDVVFIGTWFPERGFFFYELKKRGLNVDIYGPRWDRDIKYYRFLKKNIHLKHYSLSKIPKILNKYKIAIALYSKGNNDDISNRSIEIPISGTVICSEKSKTLEKILIKNKEAIYFKNANECKINCIKLLKNPKKIKKISFNSKNKLINKYNPESEYVYDKIINYDYLKIKKEKFVI